MTIIIITIGGAAGAMQRGRVERRRNITWMLLGPRCADAAAPLELDVSAKCHAPMQTRGRSAHHQIASLSCFPPKYLTCHLAFFKIKIKAYYFKSQVEKTKLEIDYKDASPIGS